MSSLCLIHLRMGCFLWASCLCDFLFNGWMFNGILSPQLLLPNKTYALNILMKHFKDFFTHLIPVLMITCHNLVIMGWNEPWSFFYPLIKLFWSMSLWVTICQHAHKACHILSIFRILGLIVQIFHALFSIFTHSLNDGNVFLLSPAIIVNVSNASRHFILSYVLRCVFVHN